MDQQRFLQQLQIVLNPSQGDVKAATGVLQKEFYPRPESLALLIQLITSHDNPDLRQLAAVEARSLISKHWTKVPAAQRPHVRTQLLQATISEEKALVRHASARVISSIAKIDLADGEWPELPGILQQAATSSNKDERAMGIFILFSILEIMGDEFADKFQDLFTLFSKTIQDPESSEVRINTMLALSRLAMLIDTEEDPKSMKAFQDIFPSMVAVLKDSIDEKDEDRIMQAFEVFQTLLGCDAELMRKHLKDLVIFMNEIASNTDLAEDTRIQAISFLMQAVKYRKTRIQGMRIGEQLALSSLKIVTELGEAADDEEDITPARSALGLLDIMAQSLPPNQVIVPMLNALPQYSKHQDPDYRRAGILSLGMCVEGAPDFIGTQVPEVLPIALQLLEDPEVKVRQAALHSIARFAEDVPEDICKEHAKLLPALVKNLQASMQAYSGEEKGPSINMMKAACSAIDAFVDNMDEEDATPYAERLVPLLQKLFEHPDFKIKALAASALGSLASTVSEAFLPFVDDSMSIMQEYVTKKEGEDELELRASVTDAMGEIASAAGPERFHRYVQPLMQASEEALHLDHSRLKESSYILWGSLAKVYEEEFTPFLNGVVKALFECIDQEEADLEVELGDNAKDLVGQEVTIAGKKVKVSAAEDDDDPVAGEDGDIEDVEIDEDDADWDDLTTVTPIALEKEIAVEVMGDIITHTKQSYLPHFEKTIEKIMPLCEHTYEGIRKATIGTLHRAYAMLWDVCEESGQMSKWKPGIPLQVQPTAEIKKFAELLMTATLTVWNDEDEPNCVVTISQNLAENLKTTGPALVADPKHLQKVVEIVTIIISKQHPCQIDMDDTGDEPDADLGTSEMDWLVIDSALDVVAGLAVALGPAFAELWQIYEKPVMRFAAGSEAIERSTAVGVIAEMINGMGEAITPYTTSLLKLLLHRLSDEDPQTKSNAAYAVGRLIEKSNSDAELIKAYPTILNKLSAFLEMKGESRLPDNAAGCVSRMILKHRDQVPIEEVLPAMVDTVLPLKDDFEENEPIFNMIAQLYKWEDGTVRRLTPKLIPIFQSVLGEPEEQLRGDTRSVVVEVVEYLRQMSPNAADWDAVLNGVQ